MREEKKKKEEKSKGVRVRLVKKKIKGLGC